MSWRGWLRQRVQDLATLAGQASSRVHAEAAAAEEALRREAERVLRRRR